MAIRGRTIGGAAGAGAAAVIAVLVVMTGRWEGLELRAYRDIVGVWTICYGDTHGVRPGEVRTKAQCDTGFAKLLGDYRDGVDACLQVPVPTEVEVSFVDLAYNNGVAAVCRSTLIRKANEGDLRGACDELLKWVYAGGKLVQGLVNRRKQFHQLCISAL